MYLYNTYVFEFAPEDPPPDNKPAKYVDYDYEGDWDNCGPSWSTPGC